MLQGLARAERERGRGVDVPDLGSLEHQVHAVGNNRREKEGDSCGGSVGWKRVEP